MDQAAWSFITNIADNLTTVILLLGGVYLFFSGKVPTPSHHKEVVIGYETRIKEIEATWAARLKEQQESYASHLEEIRKSEERAWTAVAKAQDALAANNSVVDRSTDAIQNLTRLLDQRGRR